jgi:hypothetical protein
MKKILFPSSTHDPLPLSSILTSFPPSVPSSPPPVYFSLLPYFSLPEGQQAVLERNGHTFAFVQRTLGLSGNDRKKVPLKEVGQHVLVGGVDYL